MNLRHRLPHLALLIGLLVSAAAHCGVALDRGAGPTGIYRLDDGRILYLAPMVDGSGATLQFALSDGLVGRARKQGPNQFADEDACVHRFVVTENEIAFADCASRHTARLAHRIAEQPVSIQASDGKRITGSIWIAEGTSPRSGIVLAHGADDETRQMGVILPQLAEAGLAVLSFDQRGSGDSGGNWRRDGIERIAGDVAQFAGLLRDQARLAAVGFFGFSNGGWVAPAAAVRFARPAFVVIKSGDSQTVEQNVLFETRSAVERHGGATAARRAHDVMHSMLVALRKDRDDDWADARRNLAEVQGQPWLQYTQLPPLQAIPLSASMKDAYRRQLFFDPHDDLVKLTCPVLVMLGDRDVDVEGPRSAAIYRQYFGESKNARATVVLVEGAGHQLVSGPGPAANNSMETGYYAKGYPRDMVAWLKQVNDSE